MGLAVLIAALYCYHLGQCQDEAARLSRKQKEQQLCLPHQ